MPNFALSAWAAIVLVFLFITTHHPPSTPLKPITDGAQYELRFDAPRTLDTDHPARWSKTPCGRVTHIRSWADVN